MTHAYFLRLDSSRAQRHSGARTQFELASLLDTIKGAGNVARASALRDDARATVAGIGAAGIGERADQL